MASNFKNKFVQPAATEVAFALGGTNGAVPAATQIVIIGLTCANNTESISNVSVKIYLSDGGDSYFLIKDAPIPNGGTLSVLDNKLVLEVGNIIAVSTTKTGSVDAILSYLEVT